MIDFNAIRSGNRPLTSLNEPRETEELRALTNEMIDRMQALIARSTDEDVVFEPYDPEADDPYAADEAERHIPWTLGHLIVHTTASAEESAFLAAELARGVEFHGRSRYEVPWREVTTIQQCRDRLEESRRMRLATLDVWPDAPHLDNFYQSRPDRPRFNAIGRFLLGLRHDDSHLAQIEDVATQAAQAR